MNDNDFFSFFTTFLITPMLLTMNHTDQVGSGDSGAPKKLPEKDKQSKQIC